MTADLTYSEHYRAVTVTFDAMAAVNPRMRQALDAARRLAASDVAVLLLGETGCGKNLVAQAIHNGSPRIEAPFLSVNCSALTETILESELFGHERGAFTGAERQKRGRFELADRGTLFLDEIGDMSPAMQVRLLRALDSGEVRRVGEERAFHVDVRIVGASAKDLTREATEGRFRWDLFYRVSTVVVEVPPLRARHGDIALLVQHFAATVGRRLPLKFSPEALERLVQYAWPGNIRELRNVIERVGILHEGDEVRVSDLPPEIGGRLTRVTEQPAIGGMLPLHEVERLHVERVLGSTGWNKARAARVLQVDIKTLNKKIRDFGITRPA
ncbi:MAG: sigma-54-dependent Fis family transcriptional regulator [Planctomycetes bacterium]|nr:sigma-54-dependent Fis family transcriptional regulator [Planctomycetota bacterium]